MEREQIRERLASAASMPKDVVLGASIITITGMTEICVENYRGITEYTDCMVRLQTKEGQLKITGKRLNIQYYTNDEMKITGAVEKIEFSGGRKKD